MPRRLLSARSHRPGPARAVARAVTAALVLSLPAAGVLAGSPAGAATAPAVGRPVTVPAGRPGHAPVAVLLPTGDRVTVGRTPTGRPVVDVVRVATRGPAASFVRRTTTRGTYVVPTSAMPYVGRLLDPELFDVARLHAGARIPVRLTFTAGAPSVPGVTITSRGAGAASGYLTARSARTFGAALARQFTADAAKGFPRRSSLFGATGIRSAATAPVVVSPQFPMRTVIIKALDSAGKPLPFGFVDVFAVDDASKYFGFGGIVVDGEARVSLPVGTYALHGVGFEADAAGNVTSGRTTVVDDYVVSTQNQVVTLDDRLATARPTMTTPTSAALDSLVHTWGRTDAAGNGSFSSSLFTSGGVPLLLQPQPAPKVGTLRSAAQFTAVTTPAAGTSTLYTANYAADGVPAGQTHAFRLSRAQAVRPTYYADVLPRSAQLARSVIDPELGGTGVGVVTPLPGTRKEYVLGDAPGVYADTLFAAPDPFTNPFGDMVDDGFRLIRPGTTTRPDWLRAPHLARVPAATDGFSALGFDPSCAACRSADAMTVVVDPAQDTTPGHSFATFGRADGVPVARFRVLRDGVTVFDENDVVGADLEVPAGTATYRVMTTVDRVPSSALLSTRTRTDITFVSSAADRGAVPAGQTCFLADACTVLPILSTDLTLPVDGRDAVPLGDSTVKLRVGHLVGAPRTAVTSAAVEIRFPGGPWTRLPLERTGDGRYTAHLSLPAQRAGALADLKVTARDAAGGVLVQTALAAFAVNAS